MLKDQQLKIGRRLKKKVVLLRVFSSRCLAGTYFLPEKLAKKMRQKANSSGGKPLLLKDGDDDEDDDDGDDDGGVEGGHDGVDDGGVEGGHGDAKEGGVREGSQPQVILAQSISESPQVIWPFLFYRATSSSHNFCTGEGSSTYRQSAR